MPSSSGPSHLALIGTGLIGASASLAIRATYPSVLVSGFDASPEMARQALEVRAIDRVLPLRDAVEAADLVLVATPVRAMRSIFQAIAPVLAPGALVTDTGSTKTSVMQWASELLPDTVEFVGGHPMAGKTLTGARAADAGLFQGAVWCLVPRATTSDRALARLRSLVASVGAEPFVTEPQTHDVLVAAISHLPYFLSIAFLEHLAREDGFPEMTHLAAGGFASLTHLTDSDPRMFADIAATNREAIVQRIDRFAAALQDLRAAVASGAPELRARLERAQAIHREWLNKTGGSPGEPPVRGCAS